MHPNTSKQELSFEDFLILVKSEQDELLDEHFRPQYLNLMIPVCSPSYIGRLEDWSAVTEFFNNHNIQPAQQANPRTNARKHIDRYFSNEAVQLVLEKYADDFDIFGYDKDISRIDHAGTAPALKPDNAPLMKWILNDEFPFDRVDGNTQAFEKYKASNSQLEKSTIIEAALCQEDNWMRLREYAIHAMRSNAFALAKEIASKIHDITSAHQNFVSNSAIFSRK